MITPSALRATARIARRDAWRHKGRSALIVAMVGLPVLGLGAADVLARTMQLDPNERVVRQIGQADVGLVINGGVIEQNADPQSGYQFTTGPGNGHGTTLLPPGTAAYRAAQRQALLFVHATLVTTFDHAPRVVRANGLQVQADVVALDLNSPLTQGMAQVVSGQAPRTTSEIALSPTLAANLGATRGSTVSLLNRTWTVSGLVRNPNDTRAISAYGLPAALNIHTTSGQLLARTSGPVRWSAVRQLNRQGVVVTSRSVIEHPPPEALQPFATSTFSSADGIGVETVAIGMAILEVTLLAGAAFAVGARRQRRNLALLAAAGGDATIVRSVVLAGGVVLGALGAVLGCALGIVLATLTLPIVEHFVHRVPGHFDIRPLEQLAVVALGLFTGIVASVLPARAAARDDVVLALSGRRGAVRTPRRIWLLGLVMVISGVLIADRATRSGHFRIILAGAVLAELGFVVCSPALVGLASKLGKYVGLAPRLALRDAARHRGRSGPAVAAVMAAVAGSIAVSTYIATSVHRDRIMYEPQARIGQPIVQLYGDSTAAMRARVADVVRTNLGATTVADVPSVKCVRVGATCRAVFGESGQSSSRDIAIGGPSTLRLLIGRTDPAAEQALAGGKIVMFSAANDDGVWRATRGDDEVQIKGLPIVSVDAGKAGASLPGIMSPQAATRLHMVTQHHTIIATTPQMPTDKEVARANDQLPKATYLLVERGYSPGSYSAGLVVLALIAAIVMLGATAVSVGLSMAESKPDLVTLTAVGGRPSTRRLLVASQAGTVAVLGASMGVVAGIVPAWAVLNALHHSPFTLPWATIGLTVIGIPLLAMLGAAALAGSQTTIDRRVG